MTLLVLEYGARTIGPVVEATLETSQEIGLGEISLLYADEAAKCNYKRSSCALEDALEMLQSGEVSSVMIMGDRERHGFMMVDRPDASETLSLLWHGYGERRGKFFPKMIEPYKKIAGLQYIYLSLEDTLDIDPESELSVETFPWDHWRLLCAAVRNNDGTWKQREGLAASSLG